MMLNGSGLLKVADAFLVTPQIRRHRSVAGRP